MPSNLLIFDAEYVSELTSRMNLACDLMAEAVSSLKSAQNHENWKCKERTRILGDFDELNLKLGRLDSGVNETTRILGGSVSRFAALESQYDSQAETLSDELTSNHGYAASVRTDTDTDTPFAGGQQAQPGAAGAAATATGSAGAGAAGTAGAAGQAGPAGGGSGSGVGRVTGVVGAMAGRTGRGGQGNRESGAGTSPASQGVGGGGGGGTMNVNLPVTHIPDSPDAAARGTKDTKAIADEAVNMTVHTITLAFAGTGENLQDISGLAQAYNAGRSIFENSAIIIASPTQAHTTERLAMAAGIMNLAGNSSAGLGRAASQAVGAAAASGETIRTKARNLLSSAQENSEAGELRQLLGVLAGSSSESVMGSSSGGGGSGGGGKSFFESIVEELKKTLSGEGSAASSSSSASSPVAEFLNNFVMDQV